MSTGTVIGLERFTMGRGQRFSRHAHDRHQLIWASSGVLMVDVDDRCWVLPTTLALWMPAGTGHAPRAVRESVMEGVYLDPATCPVTWLQPTVVAITPLARHLIDYLAHDLPGQARSAAELVLLDTLTPVRQAMIPVPMPRDPRAADAARLILMRPDDSRGLDRIGPEVGASARTLQRLFLTETGLSFGTWRTHARLREAMAQLADDAPVARVAERVGYSSVSAFVAAFRRVTGQTPGAYFAVPGRHPDSLDA